MLLQYRVSTYFNHGLGSSGVKAATLAGLLACSGVAGARTLLRFQYLTAPAECTNRLSVPGEIRVRTIQYATARVAHDKMMPLRLDLYEPQPSRITNKRPLVISLFGGGFQDGKRDSDEQVALGRCLTARGYAVASITYRQMGDQPVVSKAFLPVQKAVEQADYEPIRTLRSSRGPLLPIAAAAATEDAVAALQWAWKSADALEFDKERIFLLGASAGAVTALNAAYQNQRFGFRRYPIAGVVEIRGMLVDVREPGRRLLPLNGPPLFMLHGTADELVPFGEAVRLYGLARSGNIDVEFHPFAAKGHELGGIEALIARLDSGEIVLDRLDAFLKRYVHGSARLGAVCIGVGHACP